jgi:hypothetical protein
MARPVASKAAMQTRWNRSAFFCPRHLAHFAPTCYISFARFEDKLSSK